MFMKEYITNNQIKCLKRFAEENEFAYTFMFPDRVSKGWYFDSNDEFIRNDYFNRLHTFGFIEVDKFTNKNKWTAKITDKGKRLLELYGEMKSMFLLR
jgi:hypothetical protein